MVSEFTKYQPYVDDVVALATSKVTEDTSAWLKKADIALNGQAGNRLQALVPVRTRRAQGTFFTGHELAEQLLAYADLSQAKFLVFADPTVGASDLLIASAKLLSRKKRLTGTIKAWGAQLLGIDQQKEFIQASKARLVLLARSLHQSFDEQAIDWASVFPNIGVGDALTEKALYERATHLVMNPPFAKMAAPKDCVWAKGKVNAAAIFMEHAVKHAKPGTQILAILPEVLRTGTRYKKWQQEITRMADVERVMSVGLFHNADVDVFILVLRKKKVMATTGRAFRMTQKRKGARRLGDLFKVSVGPVVPHRDPEEGPLYRYLHAKNAKPWVALHRRTEERRYRGTVFTPPLVVVRRTSRPGDKHRATASLVLGRAPVAVENHLIVCQPYDGQVSTCERLMEALRAGVVDAHLDKEMRCRHLTVASVRELPI
ncbi:MAG: SAM-dependent methyltransferase [Flavobacteriales bacterium]|nr:SAM-dependent methyltransferase [Flavobacteriales bacterium]